MADTNMTVDQAIAYAIQWAPATVRGADGWRVVCMVLAQEVQRLRGERKVLADLLERSIDVLADVRTDTDDTETYRMLTELINHSRAALMRVSVEVMRETTGATA